MRARGPFVFAATLGVLSLFLWPRPGAVAAPGEKGVAALGTIVGFVTPAEVPAPREKVAVPDPRDHGDCGKEHDPRWPIVKEGKLVGCVVFVKTNVPKGPWLGFPSSTPAVLDQRGCRYEPRVLVVALEQKLVIKNSDTVAHNVKLADYESPQIGPGGSVEQVFKRSNAAVEGRPIHCTMHQGFMHGAIVLAKHPFVAVTDASGRFELGGLPPGDYTLGTWHDALKAASRSGTPVSVKASATTELTLKH